MMMPIMWMGFHPTKRKKSLEKEARMKQIARGMNLKDGEVEVSSKTNPKENAVSVRTEGSMKNTLKVCFNLFCEAFR